MLLMILSAVVTFYMDSIGNAWRFLMAVGAGTGLVYILRWFWWRINAWSEISAMIAAFVVSMILQFGFHLNESEPKDFAYLLLITVSATTAVWLTVTFLTQPEHPGKITLILPPRPANPTLWKPIAAEATDIVPQKDGIFNLVNWISGVTMIYAFLFGTGKIIQEACLPGLPFSPPGSFLAELFITEFDQRGWEVLIS